MIYIHDDYRITMNVLITESEISKKMSDRELDSLKKDMALTITKMESDAKDWRSWQHIKTIKGTLCSQIRKTEQPS